MRLFLDAHVPGRAIGKRLRERGDDVFAVDEHGELEGLDDVALLQLAAEEGRIMVTFNVKDFPEILREWAEEGREHAGCILLVGVDHSQFGPILRLLEAALAQFPDQEDWRNRPLFVAAASG